MIHSLSSMPSFISLFSTFTTEGGGSRILHCNEHSIGDLESLQYLGFILSIFFWIHTLVLRILVSSPVGKRE